MSGKKASEGPRNPFGSGKRGRSTMGGRGTSAQRKAEGEVRIFLPQNGNLDVSAIFGSGLQNTFEPLFDEAAAALKYNDVYLKVKEKPFWPELLTQTCMAFYRVNHEVIPETEPELREAQVEQFVEGVKRSGRDFYPDFQPRINHLRKAGFTVWATKAREAAKTFAKRKGEQTLSSHFLKEILAVLWLPASLWMLEDQRIAAALPMLLNKEGKSFLTDWIGETGSIQRQAVARVRRDFGFPRAKEMFGNHCASFDATGNLAVNWSVCGSWRKRRNQAKK